MIPPSGRESRAHYLWALLGLLGGMLAYLSLKERDPDLAWRVLLTSAVVTLLVLFVAARLDGAA